MTGLARHDHPQTAKQAARKCKTTLRTKILAYIKRRSTGATDAEIQRALHLDGNTVRPRRVELAGMGLIEQNGLKRKTPAGRRANVWVATGGAA